VILAASLWYATDNLCNIHHLGHLQPQQQQHDTRQQNCQEQTLEEEEEEEAHNLLPDILNPKIHTILWMSAKLHLFEYKPLPYILENNTHPGFGDILNGKKLVRDSNTHLSFTPCPHGN
jgi:hypothetical protein